jgi:hypothetical protein
MIGRILAACAISMSDLGLVCCEETTGALTAVAGEGVM